MNLASRIGRCGVLGVFFGVALVAGSAWAGCEPPCPSGQQCRYEAAGGKFYCEALPKSGGKVTPGGKPGPAGGGAVAPGGAATPGGATAPAAVTPK